MQKLWEQENLDAGLKMHGFVQPECVECFVVDYENLSNNNLGLLELISYYYDTRAQ